MTQTHPVAFWIQELDATTDVLRQRRRVVVRSERRQGNTTTTEEHAVVEHLQAAADRGRKLTDYLTRQPMSEDERRAYLAAIARHGQALLPLTGDQGERAQVEAMIATAREALGQ